MKNLEYLILLGSISWIDSALELKLNSTKFKLYPTFVKVFLMEYFAQGNVHAFNQCSYIV